MPSEKEIKVEVFDESLDEATRAKLAQYAENLLADGEVILERIEIANPQEVRDFIRNFAGFGGNEVINSTEHHNRVHAVAVLAAERSTELGDDLSTALAKAKFFSHTAVMLEALTELAWDVRDGRQQLTKAHYQMYTEAYARGRSKNQMEGLEG